MDPKSENPQVENNPPVNEETKPKTSPVPEPNTKIINNPPAPKNRKSSIFWKVALGIVVVALLLFGGYYLGMRNNKPSQISPTPTQTIIKVATQAPTETPSTPTNATKKTVKAGLQSSTSFKPYSIEIPSGWDNNHESTSISDKLTITKNDYSLIVNQAAFGGGGCTYKGDPSVELSQKFTDFVDISAPSGQYRRGWNQDAGAKTISYTICQKGSDNSYGSITQFGRIDAASPNPSDQATLAELDGMISSLAKQ